MSSVMKFLLVLLILDVFSCEAQNKEDEVLAMLEFLIGGQAKLSNQLKALENKTEAEQQDISARLSKLECILNLNCDQEVLIEASDESLNTTLSNNSSEISGNIGSIGNKFADLESLMSSMNKSMIDSIASLTSNISEMSEDINHLKIAQDHMKTSQYHMKTSQDHMKTSQDQMTTSQNHMMTSQNHMKTSQDQMKTSQNRMKTSQDQMKISQNQMKTSQNHMKTSQNQIQKILKHIPNCHIAYTPRLGCISAIKTRMTFEAAESLCIDRGQRLFEYFRSTDINMLWSYFGIDTQWSYWVGVKHEKWLTTNEDVSQDLWKSGEPSGGDEHCGILDLHKPGIGLNDFGCTNTRYVLCQSF